MEFFANPKIQQAVEWLIQKKDKAVDITKRVLIAADQKITALGDWAIRSWNNINPINIPRTSILAKMSIFGYQLPESWNKEVGYSLTLTSLVLMLKGVTTLGQSMTGAFIMADAPTENGVFNILVHKNAILTVDLFHQDNDKRIGATVQHLHHIVLTLEKYENYYDKRRKHRNLRNQIHEFNEKAEFCREERNINGLENLIELLNSIIRQICDVEGMEYDDLHERSCNKVGKKFNWG